MDIQKKLLASAVLSASVILAGCSTNDVPSTMGSAVNATPLAEDQQPHNPWLAESERSSMHGGSYNRNQSTYPGPLGKNTEATHRVFSRILGVAPNISFDSKGRLITVSIKFTGIELHLLDPDTLETIARYDMPRKKSRDNSGGGYFHLDNQDRPILAPADNTIKILELDESGEQPEWLVAEEYSLEGVMPEGSNIHDIMPDWQGNLWFVTSNGYMGYRDQKTGEFYTYKLEEEGEVIQNSFAVDEEGVYIVSTHALYQFQIDEKTRKPVYTWRQPYNRGEQQKPGTLSHGSGTSPTLIGKDLVTIADDGYPSTNVVVFQRNKDIQGDRKVCEVPIFKPGKSATENSLLVHGNAIVVQNDYGHVYSGNALETSPGVTRIDVREDRSGCDVAWESELLSQSLPRLSTATGLLYFYTFKKQNEEDRLGGWYLTALDFATGEEKFDRLIGTGTGGMLDTLSSVTAPVVLGPNGAAYVGIRTGVVAAVDKKK
ncbi:MAG: hypothetical protein ACR2PX_00300 [Endozoicomonas sp.]|uniref:hypothetical protein n=1 Tax=Endozoicomonas sp. TaxID=1892382 RepID=UPI003D9B8D7A